MTVPSLQSILIGSQHPDDLKTWYAKTFDAPEADDGALMFGGVRLLILEHDEVAERAQEPARVILNLHTDDISASASALRAKGVRFTREPTELPFGILSTLQDPDGNYVQLVQLFEAVSSGAR